MTRYMMLWPVLMSTEIIVALFENSCWLFGTWNGSMCTHAYMITKWFPTQWTAAAVCLEFLVNSYEDTVDQEHFALRYELFWEREKWHFRYCTLLCIAVFCEAFWASVWVLMITKALKGEGWVLKQAFRSVFVEKLYGFSLSIAYIARLCHPYIESLLTLW